MNKTSKPDPTFPEQPVPQPAPVLPGNPIIEPDAPVILPVHPHDPLEPDLPPHPPKLPPTPPEQPWPLGPELAQNAAADEFVSGGILMFLSVLLF